MDINSLQYNFLTWYWAVQIGQVLNPQHEVSTAKTTSQHWTSAIQINQLHCDVFRRWKRASSFAGPLSWHERRTMLVLIFSVICKWILRCKYSNGTSSEVLSLFAICRGTAELLKNITYLEDYKDLDNRKLNISSSSGGLSNTSSLAKPLSASLIIARCTELLSSPQSCIAGKFSTTWTLSLTLLADNSWN